MNRFTRACNTALILAASCLAAACTVATGGGSAGGNIGGPAGSGCNQSFQVEGCYASATGQQRMACTGGSWQPIASCNAGEVCIQAPAGNGFTTSCKSTSVPVGGSDVVSSGNDTTTSGPDVTSVGKDSTTTGPDGSTTGPTSAMMKCAVQKCSSIWSMCSSDPMCLAAAMCMDGCGSDAGCQYSCTSDATGPAASTLASLAQCAQAAGCASMTGPVCGNGTCETGETASSCAQDCSSGPVCGNGTCEAGETKANCPKDCGSTGPVCGNGKCETGETKNSCPKDCLSGPVCGNGTCESGETASSCAADCGDPTNCIQQKCGSQMTACQSNSGCMAIITCLQGCQDQTCANGCVSKATSQAQSLFMAANDCAAQCSATATKCGDGQCNGTETASSCPADCGGGGYCGDGTCSGTETPSNCASDCGSTPDTCGDGTCQAGESANTCAVDCDPTTKCLVQACGDQLNTCFGNTACAGIFDCFGGCANGDQACLQGCYSAATATGQQYYQQYATCAQNSGCLPQG